MLSRQAFQSIYLNRLLPAAFLMPVAVWLRPVTGYVAYYSGDKYSYNATLPKPACILRADSQHLTSRNAFGKTDMFIPVILMLTLCLICPGKTDYVFLPVIPVIFGSILIDDTFSQFTGAAFFSYFYTLLNITFINHET